MFARSRRLLKRLSLLFVFTGLLFGRTTEPRHRAIPKRIAAVQKAVRELPPAIRESFILNAQWGNWGNWNNWNNWANWANWNNWNNWGNWRNY
jgi:hypothetical protein